MLIRCPGSDSAGLYVSPLYGYSTYVPNTGKYVPCFLYRDSGLVQQSHISTTVPYMTFQPGHPGGYRSTPRFFDYPPTPDCAITPQMQRGKLAPAASFVI